VISDIYMYLSVCLLIRVLNGKWLELSIPKSVEIYNLVYGRRQALTLRSKGSKLGLKLGLGWERGVSLHAHIAAHLFKPHCFDF